MTSSTTTIERAEYWLTFSQFTIITHVNACRTCARTIAGPVVDAAELCPTARALIDGVQLVREIYADLGKGLAS
jgi:hypothetical protein